MSMQLDPDIEFKVASNRLLKSQQLNEYSSSDDETLLNQISKININTNANKDNENNENEELNIYERFQLYIQENDNRLCDKQQSSHKGTHFSDLPIEVVIYILKWVVSDELDVRSLETFSTVCKGLYVCARDPEIWRLASEK